MEQSPLAQQTVTTACHHCADPGCLTGCPAEAYEKDPVTGVVKHLDDACIGCQYCTLTCPYDVPLYNDRLGIVRKCDLCADRLADGEAPACVQGCPTEAISVTTVRTAELLTAAPTDRMTPGAAPSTLTKPATLYRGDILAGDSVPADLDDLAPAHAHLPLVVMLVLSQLSIGMCVLSVIFGSGLTGAMWSSDARGASFAAAAALAIASAAASFAHLGQPLKAWRVVLGWAHSWLSREALLLPAYIAAVALASALAFVDHVSATWVAAVAGLLGIATVACSTLIYVVTGRRLWAAPLTTARFASTVLAGGFGWVVIGASAEAAPRSHGVVAACAMVIVAVATRSIDRSVLGATDRNLARSASLLRGPLLAMAQRRRTTLGASSALFVVAALLNTSAPITITIATIALGLLVISELLERRLFFQACAPMTMPGAIR